MGAFSNSRSLFIISTWNKDKSQYLERKLTQPWLAFKQDLMVELEFGVLLVFVDGKIGKPGVN